MSYTIKETKKYPNSKSDVCKALLAAIEGLEGKIISQNDASNLVVAQFNKTIHGKVLGEKTELNITVNARSDNETTLELEAYPLDAIGRKLMFGARKGVTRTVLDWFYAHMDKNL